MDNGSHKLVYIQTFGCQMNVSESDRMAAMLKPLGYRPTATSDEATLVILNTCSVRAKAEVRVFNHIAILRKLKKRRPGLIVAIGGCVAQQEGARIMKRAPHVDIVFGTHNIHLLPAMVAAAEKGQRQSALEFLDNDTRMSLYPTVDPAGGVTAFVTIMQGCDNFCSYCIVPHVRGREVSRPVEDILAEIRAMADSGTKEITLLGQNVNSYGRGLPNSADFATLLRRVAEIDGVKRIRFVTSHPRDVSPELIRCFAEIPSLCGHIHLPAQCGSDRILSLMGRGYDRRSYLQTVSALRQARPDILITGDIIAAFPGETEAEFQETLSLMEEVRYADLFSFMYSSRPGTAAADLPELLGHDEKLERLHRLQSLQKRITREIHDSLVGSRQLVLLEGVSDKSGKLYGRTDGNRIMNVEAPPEMVGTVVELTVARAFQSTLAGRLTEVSS